MDNAAGGGARVKLRANPPRARGWLARLIDPLRARLILLLTLVLLPPTIGGILFAVRSYEEQTERVQDVVHQFAALASIHERDFFQNTWRLLVSVSRDLPLPLGSQGCPRLFGTFHEIYPEFGGLTLFDGQGNTICGTKPEDGRPEADEDWFRRVVALRDFTLSDYNLASPDDPAMVAAMPVLGDDDTLAGVIAVTVKLHRLASFLRESDLPEDGGLFVLDRQGKVLFQRGYDGDTNASAWLPQADMVEKVVTDRVVEFRAPDRTGNLRAYSVVLLQGGAVHILFGLPVASTFGWIDRDLSTRVLWLVGVCALAVGAAFVASHLLVIRWLRRLRAIVADYAAGRLDSRLHLEQAPAEFRDLGLNFSIMARRVALRESELKQIIVEKDRLIREIHHRVRNNMQTVLSLTTLRLGRVKDPQTRAAVTDIETRVKALALVQRHLYLDSVTALVDMNALVNELVQSVGSGRAGQSPGIAYEVDFPPLALDQDQATPLALILSELLTNARRHAFPGDRQGTIRIEGRRAASEVTVSVSDDGVGFDPKAPRGLGLTLLPGLAKQLGAQSMLETGPSGTLWMLTFRLTGARS